MKSLEYYQYQTKPLKCKQCLYAGIGKDFVQGEVFAELFEICCPKCNKISGIVSFPTEDEVLKFGSKKDKLGVKKRKSERKKIEDTRFKSAVKLKEISGDVKIEFNETNISGDIWIEIYINEALIGKEMAYYEYCGRIIELIKMLNERYPNKITSIVYESTSYLLGDYIPISIQLKDLISEIISKNKLTN